MIQFISSAVTLDAAAGEDSPRTITGVAVPWDTPATVSGGERVMFSPGAFDLEGKRPKLLEGHDMSQLRGVVTEMVNADEGLLFTATFAKTTESQIVYPGSATTLPDGTVLVTGCAAVGELPPSATVCGVAERYDAGTDTFKAEGPMRFPKGGYTATRLLTGEVLFVGGNASAELFR